jgi:hypothetical protein
VWQCVAVRAGAWGNDHISIRAVRAAMCVDVLGSVWQRARAVVCDCLAVRQCVAVR